MNVKTPEISYLQTDEKEIDLIGPLWRKLRIHHKERSVHFKDQYDTFTWDMRKKGLLNKAGRGALLIDLARDNDTIIGYCVSSINGDKQGEIESIFIEKEYRRHHIGDKFMKTALAWMDAHNVNRKIIGVGVGNEEVFNFYKRYGFYPRTHILMQVNSKK